MSHYDELYDKDWMKNTVLIKKKSGSEWRPFSPENIPERAHTMELNDKAPNKYLVELGKETKYIDVYDVLSAFDVTNPASQHAVKKILMAGRRGYKETVKDLTEAVQSLERAIELETVDD